MPLLLLWMGCISGVTQVAGTGAVYTTRCSSDMDPVNSTYVARCTPPSCDEHFHSTAVNNVVVALDPGNKVVGYGERVCLQDLSQASALFSPVPVDTDEPTAIAPTAATPTTTPAATPPPAKP